MVKEPLERKSCSFERIYFSRGSDKDIYRERKTLGELLMPGILNAIDFDLRNTVFSYIPNTAETAFYGLLNSIQNYLAETKKEKILSLGKSITDEELSQILTARPRIEKIAVKDIKLRTFITQDKGRDELVEHVYDITYGSIRKGIDNLVVID